MKFIPANSWFKKKAKTTEADPSVTPGKSPAEILDTKNNTNATSAKKPASKIRPSASTNHRTRGR